MEYTMEGVITRIADEKKFSDNFTMKEFILHVAHEKYPQDIKFQLSNKTLDLVGPGHIGMPVTVHFNIRGRGTSKGYFNNLVAWRIEVHSKPAHGSVAQHQVPSPVAKTFQDAEVVGNIEEDNLPF